MEAGWLEVLDAALDSIRGEGLAVPRIHEIDEGSWTIDRASPSGSACTITSPFLDFSWDEPLDVEGKECTCTIAGGAWMVRKEWYDRLGGLDEGMAPWGGENIDFPLRTWSAGGFCLVSDEAAVGHLYRQTPRPEVEASDVLRNKIRAAHTAFSRELFQEVMMRLRSLPAFREALAKTLAGRSSLARLKERTESLRVRDETWILDTFRLPLLESAAFHRSARQRRTRAPRGPLVSVVVPARGGAGPFLETVRSVLEETTYGNRELIVVSSPGSPELAEAAGLLRARGGRARILTLSGRLGGGLPESVAAAATAAPYCAFLEPGTRPVDAGWIERAIESFETHERAVLISGAIVLDRGSGSGEPLLRLATAWDRRSPTWIDERWAPASAGDRPEQCLCPSPGALIVDRGRFAAMGGFDPTVEQGALPVLDLSLRIWLSGGEVIRDPRIGFLRREPAARAREDGWTQYSRVLPFVKCSASTELAGELRGISPLAEPLLERHADHIRRERRRFLERAAFDESWLFYKFGIGEEMLGRPGG